jgi:multidrug efflux system outer membrane protein
MEHESARARRPLLRRARTGAGVVLSVVALSLIAACTLEPRYRSPALPVPDQWPIPATVGAAAPVTDAGTEDATAGAAGNDGAAGASGAEAPSRTAQAASDIGWRDFFIDAHLQQLIALALANNRDLRVAVLNIERARAAYRIQRGALLPSLQAVGAYTKQSIPAVLTGFGLPLNQSYYSAELAVSAYQLDLFGRVRSLTHAALEQYFAQEETRRSTQLSLIAEIANAYLTLASDRELQRLAQQTLASQQQSFDLTRRRHDTGAASGLDLAQAETTVESARADVEHYGGVVQTDIDALTLLVGSVIPPELLPNDFAGQVAGLAPLPAGMPSAVLLRRPDVLAAEHTLRSQNANIGAARAAFFPTISLTGSYGTASLLLSGLFKAGSTEWTFEPQASLPIFEGGQLLGNLAAAHAQQSIALAQYEKAIQTGFREVADALALSGSLARQHQAQQALVAATARAYDLSQERYQAGRDSFLNVLDSQRSYYAAQQGLIAVRLAEQKNRVSLYTALGGGWREHGP